MRNSDQDGLFVWFLREDGKTWHFTVSKKPSMFAMVLCDPTLEEYYPETHSGETDVEYLDTIYDLDKAKRACMLKLKTYLNQQTKQRRKWKKKLKDLI